MKKQMTSGLDSARGAASRLIRNRKDNNARVTKVTPHDDGEQLKEPGFGHAFKKKAQKCGYWICSKLAHSPYFSAITTILTFYALFGDDMRLVLTQKPADLYFDIITSVTMGVFFSGNSCLLCWQSWLSFWLLLLLGHSLHSDPCLRHHSCG
jgi:hypothetical protein